MMIDNTTTSGIAVAKSLILLQAGCLNAKLENSQRLMDRPDFADAVRAAPSWTADALKSINNLEERIEAP